jgi:hypothetical protein
VEVAVVSMNTEDTHLVMKKMHFIAEYPILSDLAKKRTTATHLDGRCCFFLYQDVLSNIELKSVTDRELAFMRSLGLLEK